MDVHGRSMDIGLPCTPMDLRIHGLSMDDAEGRQKRDRRNGAGVKMSACSLNLFFHFLSDRWEIPGYLC